MESTGSVMQVLTSKDFAHSDSSKNAQGLQNPQKKKRKRVSHTCTSCKNRKIKCDQGRPCSSCVKKNIPPEFCIYEESPFIPTVEHAKDEKEAVLLLQQENKKLKQELADLKQKTLSNSKSEISPTDKADRTVTLTRSLTVRPSKIVYTGSSNWRSLLDSDENCEELIKDATDFIGESWKSWMVERKLEPVEYADFNEESVTTPEDLLLKLAKFLPDYDALENYLKIFINSYWNHYINVIDDVELMKDFHQIFVRDYNSNTFKIVVASKSQDYSKVAVILLCLKFVVLTFNSIYVESNIDSNDHLIRYVERLLNYSNFFGKSSIPSLQALILLIEIKKLNPGEIGSGDGSNIALLFKTSINMAILMGLNRNIDELYAHESERVKKKVKSIWRYLFKEDAIMSFYVGVPLSIEDSYVDHSGIRFGNLQDDLVLIIREANRLLSTVGHCKESDILRIIKKLETYNNGEFIKFSSTVRKFKSVDSFMTSFDDISSLEPKILAIYVLHVLYEILLVGTKSYGEDDPVRATYYNGNIKFGVLAVAHLIELLLKLNTWCKTVAQSVGTGDKTKLYNIVEVSLSFTVLSRIMLLKAHTGLCQQIVQSIISPGKDQPLPSSNHPSSLSLSVHEFETLDIHDHSNKLNKLSRQRYFLRGLMTLACKYMLQLNNQSFGKVFSMSFCLHAVLALYRFFNAILQKHVPKDEVEILIGTDQDQSKSQDGNSCEPNASLQDDFHKENNIWKRGNNPLEHAATKLQNLSSRSSQAPQLPTPRSTQSDTSSDMNFDFFDWKNETIDHLFDSIFADESIMSLGLDKVPQFPISSDSYGSGLDSFTKGFVPPKGFSSPK